jgi:hypothetical protein
VLKVPLTTAVRTKTQLAAPFYQGLLAELEAEGQSVAARAGMNSRLVSTGKTP